MWICMCGNTSDILYIPSIIEIRSCTGFGAPGSRNLPIPLTLAVGLYYSLLGRGGRPLAGSEQK